MIRILLISVVLITACSKGTRKESVGEPEEQTVMPSALSPEAFRDKVNSSEDIVLIDVRTLEETADGVIPGYKVIDFKAPDFSDRVASLDKEADYYLYCKSGVRSAKAAEVMAGMGFKKVHTLEGGLQAWTSDGYELKIPE
jgi:rhodanese-related sulfurtransferase